jgi:AraC-like DNA-binding protein
MILKSQFADPDKSISQLIQGFWMIENESETDLEATVLPDGMVDLLLFKSSTESFQAVLTGINTGPSDVVVVSKTKIFAVTFKLLAIEYLLRNPIPNLLNSMKPASNEFWQFGVNDLNDFELFCRKTTEKVKSIMPDNIDVRKRELFELIYSSNGSLSVKELSEKVYWSPRQINRYFNHQFGISLKAYCNILRFRASLDHIKQGRLFPEGNFFDQAHFIKEVKKLSGVPPKELKQNKNDRFLQFYAIQP